jgi:hypothetical protein
MEHLSMKYLQPKTLELLIYLLWNEYYSDEEPYELYEKTFPLEMHFKIRADLKINKIYKYIKEEISSAQSYNSDGTAKRVTTMEIATVYNHKLKSFIKKYIKAFRENKLIHAEKKYYSFYEHLQLFSKLILEPIQKENRESFTINYNFDEIDFSLAKEILQKDFELKKFRLYELLLYLNDKKYIEINKKMEFIEFKNALALADEFKNVEYILSVNVILNKEPSVISKFLLSEFLPDSDKPKRRYLKFSGSPEEVKNSKQVFIYISQQPIILEWEQYSMVYKIAESIAAFDVKDDKVNICRINKKIKYALGNPDFYLLQASNGHYILNDSVYHNL